MQLDDIIRMIDNKEYKSVEHNALEELEWFDMKLENENIIRIEKCTGIDGESDHFLVAYMVPSERIATIIWGGDYKSNPYYIFSNIYNELERIFE